MTVADSKLKERRGQQRIRFEAPATITAGQQSIAASTKDFSERGLFIFTGACFELGSEISVAITLPAKWDCRALVCCHGRVVRSNSSGGQYGVAVLIDRFTPLPQI
jgi:hypothetical protein